LKTVDAIPTSPNVEKMGFSEEMDATINEDDDVKDIKQLISPYSPPICI